MKEERSQEMVMLILSAKPKLQEAKDCLKAGRTEEFVNIVARDIIGLLEPYRVSELEKYEDTPDNLKSSPNAKRMQETAELFEKALNLLWDRQTDRLRLIDEKALDDVEGLVDEVLNL